MEQLSFVLDRLSSTPAPAVLSSQNLLSLHELLISPDKEDDRRYVADAVYALFLMKAGQCAPLAVAAPCHPIPPTIKKIRLQKTKKPYTTLRQVKTIFQEHHRELYRLSGGHEISCAELRRWYKERYFLFPEDRKHVNSRIRFHKTFYRALETSPIFCRSLQSERGDWVVSTAGLDHAK